MVVPEANTDAGRYTVFLECGQEFPQELAQDLEQRFRSNPHYALCVSLGSCGHCVSSASNPARSSAISPGVHAKVSVLGM